MPDKHLTRREFLTRSGASMLGVAALDRMANPEGFQVGLQKATPGVAPLARLRAKDPSRVKLLQLTDLHFFCARRGKGVWKDPKTVSDMAKFVDMAEPDLIAVTGDLWHNNPDGLGEEFMRSSVEKCAALGVPWLFTWGNHDRMPDCKPGHEALTSAKHSLYRGGATGGNYTVQIANANDETIWELLCLNSGERGIADEQRKWLRERQAKASTPSFAVMHIPLKQYDDVWQQALASGIKHEDVASRDEDASTLPLLKELGVRACLCGHDHINDYAGELDGVGLIYGRATGYGGYGEKILGKGAKLIELNCETGAFTWVTLLPDGTRWRPEPGEQTGKGEYYVP